MENSVLSRSEQDERRRASWRFEKSISLGSILTIVTLFGGAFAYTSAWENRITRLEGRVTSNEQQMRDNRSDVRERLDRIEDKLEKVQQMLLLAQQRSR